MINDRKKERKQEESPKKKKQQGRERRLEAHQLLGNIEPVETADT